MDREWWWAMTVALVVASAAPFADWAPKWAAMAILLLLALWAAIQALRAGERNRRDKEHQQRLALASSAHSIAGRIAELIIYNNRAKGQPISADKYIADVERALENFDSVSSRFTPALSSRYAGAVTEVRIAIRGSGDLDDIATGVYDAFRYLAHEADRQTNLSPPATPQSPESSQTEPGGGRKR